jgi:hypothetical protein
MGKNIWATTIRKGEKIPMDLAQQKRQERLYDKDKNLGT